MVSNRGALLAVVAVLQLQSASSALASPVSMRRPARPGARSLVCMQQQERDADEQQPPSWPEAPPPSSPDLFVPILVGASFGGYGLIVLYDVFFGNGLCGITVTCSTNSIPGW